MPTATASDHIERNSTSSEKLNPLTGKSVSLDRFVKFWPDAETQASGTPQMWPTPTGQDNPQVRGVGKTVGTKRGTTLGGAVRMWPTPTANEDAAGTPAGKMQGMLGNHPDIRGTTQAEWSLGSLNPTWVEWLMGYEIGHTDLGHWEMPSSRRSSRRSGGQSCKRRADGRDT
tara:strand:+ start:1558 stop:2073 length:516 start_codon:yes stop_codon:yes gene_type:complete